MSLSVGQARAKFVDDCVTAPTVGVGTHAFDLTTATAANPAVLVQCGPSAAVDQWLRYISTGSPVTISTLGQTTGDTVLSVHDVNFGDPAFDCAFASFQVRACNDDFAGTPQSRVLVDAPSGVEFLIRISTQSPTLFAGSVVIAPFSPQTGDTCAAPAVATLGTNTYDPTLSELNSFASCSAFRDFFYTYTPAQTGGLTVSVAPCTQPFQYPAVTVLSVCGGVTLACSEYSELFAATAVQAGVPVIIRIADDCSTGPSQFTVSLNPSAIPSNDTCASPRVVSLGATPFDNTYATTQDASSCSGDLVPFQPGLDVYFSFTPTITGTYDLTTDGSAGLSDTQLSVNSPCAGTEIACNDNARSFLSFVRISLSAGVTYSVRVSGMGLPNSGTPVDRGAGTLTIRRSIPPANDECANAITVAAGVTAFDLYDATDSELLPTCGLPSSRDLFYRHVPTTNGPVQASAVSVGGVFDNPLTVTAFESCTPGAASVPASFVLDPQTGAVVSRVVVAGQAGVPIFFRVAYELESGDYSRPDGTGELTIGPPPGPIPANDNCPNAPLVSAGDVPVTLVNADEDCASATSTNFCNRVGDLNVFYRYTVTSTDPVFIVANDGVQYPDYAGFVISVHDACYADALACSLSFGDSPRDYVSFVGQVGQTYIIQVSTLLSSASSQVFTGSITIQNVPVCDGIDFNNDGVSPDSQDIDDFLSVFGGGACSTGTCNDIDFNNDGVSPDSEDIDAFLRVFGGGAC